MMINVIRCSWLGQYESESFYLFRHVGNIKHSMGSSSWNLSLTCGWLAFRPTAFWTVIGVLNLCRRSSCLTTTIQMATPAIVAGFFPVSTSSSTILLTVEMHWSHTSWDISSFSQPILTCCCGVQLMNYSGMICFNFFWHLVMSFSVVPVTKAISFISFLILFILHATKSAAADFIFFCRIYLAMPLMCTFFRISLPFSIAPSKMFISFACF